MSEKGSRHWWLQRLTAMALIVLAGWLMFSIIHHIDDGYDDVVAWIADPVVAVALILSLVIMAYHAQLGMQVVLEDYVASEGRRKFYRIVVTALIWIAGLLAAAGSVARVAFT